MLLVDANVVAYLLVEGERTALARRLWSTDPDWRAPRLLHYELASVFAQLVRQKALGLDTATSGLEAAVRLVRPLPADPAVGRVLEISVGLGLSAYDSTYLAAAEALGLPLVTEDRRMLRVAPQIAKDLASLVTER